MALDRIAHYACSTVPHNDHGSGLRWLPLRDAAGVRAVGLLGPYEARFAPITLSR